MKRREFLAASCALSAASLTQSGTAQAADTGGESKEYYELRLYQIETEEKQRQLEQFLGEALIPAWNRIGIKPVGVFKFLDESSLNLYVLVPHKSFESFTTARRKVMADEQFLQAGAAVLDTPEIDPVYKRVESALLAAFDGMPKLEVPSTKESRVLQLRIYESHSDKKALKKIDMFNIGGEIPIFRKTGLTPVFFGEALIDSKLPNLTYMLGFDDQEASEKAWDAFRSHPDWATLKKDPQYKDTVSNITNILLRPAACSQI